MTSRERVLASINHKDADYVPLDLGSNVSAGISEGYPYTELQPNFTALGRNKFLGLPLMLERYV